MKKTIMSLRSHKNQLGVPLKRTKQYITEILPRSIRRAVGLPSGRLGFNELPYPFYYCIMKQFVHGMSELQTGTAGGLILFEKKQSLTKVYLSKPVKVSQNDEC